MAIGNSRGIGGLKSQHFFKESMKLKRNLQRSVCVCVCVCVCVRVLGGGGGSNQKNSSLGEV